MHWTLAPLDVIPKLTLEPGYCMLYVRALFVFRACYVLCNALPLGRIGICEEIDSAVRQLALSNVAVAILAI
jgi:hypothetical protein